MTLHGQSIDSQLAASRPVGDLRAGLTKTYKPELVYEDELQTNGKISHQHHRPKPALVIRFTLEGKGFCRKRFSLFHAF